MKIRRGFTIIELMVVMGIVGLLVAIALPAVLATREKSRKSLCQHRMAQFALALTNCEAATGEFPRGGDMVHDGSGGQWPRAHAPHVYLLPYLDQSIVYQRIDIRLASERDLLIVRGVNDANELIKQIRIQSFLCPSDSNADGFARNSYRVNIGVSAAPHSLWQNSGKCEGAFFPPQSDRRAIPDGFSNTIACSERVAGDGNRQKFTPATDFWHPMDRTAGMNFGQMSQAAIDEWFADVCGSLRNPNPPHSSDMGAYWFYAGLLDTWYNHALTPNSVVPDCGMPAGMMTIGLVTARSLHSRGVNVAFMDGHTRFVTNEVDRDLWRAWATRNGSETSTDK